MTMMLNSNMTYCKCAYITYKKMLSINVNGHHKDLLLLIVKYK